MKLYIKNKKLENYNRVMDYISICDDPTFLSRLASDITTEIAKGTIEAEEAKEVLSSIKNKADTLKTLSEPTNAFYADTAYGEEMPSLESDNPILESNPSLKQPKSLKMAPKTAVSNRVGAATIVLLLGSIAMTAFMYIVLFFRR